MVFDRSVSELRMPSCDPCRTGLLRMRDPAWSVSCYFESMHVQLFRLLARKFGQSRSLVGPKGTSKSPARFHDGFTIDGPDLEAVHKF